MPHPKGKRTLSFMVPTEYSNSGTQFRDAVDTLFSVLWGQLSLNQQAQIEQKYFKEIDILNWSCEE